MSEILSGKSNAWVMQMKQPPWDIIFSIHLKTQNELTRFWMPWAWTKQEIRLREIREMKNSRFSDKKSSESLILMDFWAISSGCGRRDLNPQGVTSTRTWTVRVCQFRHFRISLAANKWYYTRNTGIRQVLFWNFCNFLLLLLLFTVGLKAGNRPVKRSVLVRGCLQFSDDWESVTPPA